MNIREVCDRIFCILFPARCLNCGDVVYYDDMFCKKCDADKPDIESCLRKLHNVPVSGAVAATLYTGNLKRAIWTLKIEPNARIVYLLAASMLDEIKSNWPDNDIDFVTPVPINPAKLVQRGFNQAGLLAKRLAELMKKPYIDGVLRKEDNAQVQHALNKRQRIENAQKAFRIAESELVTDKSVLLVDDVLTTGATVRACASLLLNGQNVQRADYNPRKQCQ